jgi:hypothetical protein
MSLTAGRKHDTLVLSPPRPPPVPRLTSAPEYREGPWMSVISAAGNGRASYTARTASMLTVPEARHRGDDVSGQPSPPLPGP